MSQMTDYSGLYFLLFVEPIPKLRSTFDERGLFDDLVDQFTDGVNKMVKGATDAMSKAAGAPGLQ